MLSSIHHYESFRGRALISATEEVEHVAGPNIAPKERLQRTVRKCIAMNKLKIILEARASPDKDSDLMQELATEHPRNVGKFTVVAFVNSASGGGMGKTIFDDLVKQLGEDYVFDLKTCTKGNMPEDNLLQYARDPCVRILACGGDGTMGWIESSIDKVWAKALGRNVPVETTEYSEHLPLAMMPLGTGNDLSRQFGWGGKFNNKMREEGLIKKVEQAKPASLDRWQCVVLSLERLDKEARAWVPRMLGEKTGDKTNSVSKLKELFADEDYNSSLSGPQSTESSNCFDGVFCNYFSIGFDANVAFQFHKERELHPERFTSPLMNKVVYVRKSPAALTAPKLKDKIRVMVTNAKGEIEELDVPKDCRAMVLPNIQSYAGGNKLTSKGQTDDGLIEVVFVTSMLRTATSFALSTAMPFLLFRVAAQTNMVCIRTKQALHCQVDGEPWLQSQGVIRISHHSRNALLKPTKRPAVCNCASQAHAVQT